MVKFGNSNNDNLTVSRQIAAWRETLDNESFVNECAIIDKHAKSVAPWAANSNQKRAVRAKVLCLSVLLIRGRLQRKKNGGKDKMVPPPKAVNMLTVHLKHYSRCEISVLFPFRCMPFNFDYFLVLVMKTRARHRSEYARRSCS